MWISGEWSSKVELRMNGHLELATVAGRNGFDLWVFGPSRNDSLPAERLAGKNSMLKKQSTLNKQKHRRALTPERPAAFWIVMREPRIATDQQRF
jgi:hypothetical protein